MKHTRHPMPGQTMPRPPTTPTHGSPLPFFHESTGCAGHDLLVLNARPDLASEKISPTHASLSNSYAGQATAFLQSCFLQGPP